MSARYSIVDEEYYEPEVLRGQSAVNHQGSEGVVELDDELNQSLSDQYKQAFKLYEQLLEKGVCREQARGVLPQSTYTSFVWKMDLHNLMHFLQLRMDHHAQKEIRDYATAIYELVQPLVPHAMEAFMDFRVNAMQLTGPEIEAINSGKTKYTAVDGIKELKHQIVKKFKDDNEINYSLNEITVGTGGKQVLYNALMATVNEGDEVIIPAPFWVSYPDMVILADGVPVITKCEEKDNFKITPVSYTHLRAHET